MKNGAETQKRRPISTTLSWILIVTFVAFVGYWLSLTDFQVWGG